MAPEDAAPSILDYRPRSTLVAPTHLVRKARYPAIDFHGHPNGMLGSVASIQGAQVTVAFTSPNPNVKPGMTAQVRIKVT